MFFFILHLFLEFLYVSFYPLTLSIILLLFVVDTVHVSKRVVPLFILFLGFTTTMQVTIIVISAVFPIMINAWAGVKTTEKSLLAAARVFGANRRQLYVKVVLPYTLPFIISGIQQGIGRGLIGVVIAELFGGSNGLGYLIQRSADTFNTAMTFAVLLLLIIMSLSLINFTRWLEAYVAPWRNTNHV